MTHTRRDVLGGLAGGLAGALASPLAARTIPAQAAPGSSAQAPQTPGSAATAASPPSLDGLDLGNWKSVRDLFSIDPEQSFFNCGTLGSCTDPVRQTVIEAMRALDARPTYHYWARLMPRYFAVRQSAAKLLGVSDPTAVTLTHSTTEGINIVARGLGLAAGDEVVMTDHEHIGGEAIWKHLAATRGIRIRRLSLPLGGSMLDDAEIVAGFERLIGPRTRVLMASHILYTTGQIMPIVELGRLARARGIDLLIDGAHPVGQMPLAIEESGCSFYTASGHKWLCGPRGTGLLYVRPDRLAAMEPLLVSYDPGHPPSDVESFDEGSTRLNFVWTNNLHDVVGLGTAIDLHLAIGADRVRARTMALTRRFRDGISDTPGLRPIGYGPPGRSAPMTTLAIDGPTNKTVFRALREQGYTTKEVLDAELPEPINALRVCTHILNSEDEVDGLIEAFDRVLRA